MIPGLQERNATFSSSREAAAERSPGRKPWVEVGNDQAPEGRQNRSHTFASSAAISGLLSMAALAAEVIHPTFSAAG